MKGKGWVLIDGEERNRLHPRTFWIPPEEDRHNREVGMYVQLNFEYPSGRGERMWVEVTEVNGSGASPFYAGRLSSRPALSDTPTFGERIEFHPCHIIKRYEDGLEAPTAH